MYRSVDNGGDDEDADYDGDDEDMNYHTDMTGESSKT